MRIDKLPTRAYNLFVKRAIVEAQLIVTRRCNLTCGYCTEHDNSSNPVAYDNLRRRVDALHRLRVTHITILGGEPLLHPQISQIVAYGRAHSTVSITTNGSLVSDDIIERLNDADLNHMQVSIDSAEVDPTHYLQKTLKLLQPKLERLKAKARFDVHLAAVLCEKSADGVEPLLQKASEIGMPITLSIVHDPTGRCAIKGEQYVSKWEYYGRQANQFGFGMIGFEYGRKLLAGEMPAWKCRAGARSLYIDEFGNAQYCSAQMGRLNKPILEYSWNDVREQSRHRKGCESGCAVDCVFRASQIDNDKRALMRELLRSGLANRHGVQKYIERLLTGQGRRSVGRIPNTLAMK